VRVFVLGLCFLVGRPLTRLAHASHPLPRVGEGFIFSLSLSRERAGVRVFVVAWSVAPSPGLLTQATLSRLRARVKARRVTD